MPRPARTITYGYDNDNELTSVSDPDANLTFTYDNDGRLHTAVTSGSGQGSPR